MSNGARLFQGPSRTTVALNFSFGMTLKIIKLVDNLEFNFGSYLRRRIIYKSNEVIKYKRMLFYTIVRSLP